MNCFSLRSLAFHSLLHKYWQGEFIHLFFFTVVSSSQWNFLMRKNSFLCGRFGWLVELVKDFELGKFMLCQLRGRAVVNETDSRLPSCQLAFAADIKILLERSSSCVVCAVIIRHEKESERVMLKGILITRIELGIRIVVYIFLVCNLSSRSMTLECLFKRNELSLLWFRKELWQLLGLRFESQMLLWLRGCFMGNWVVKTSLSLSLPRTSTTRRQMNVRKLLLTLPHTFFVLRHWSERAFRVNCVSLREREMKFNWNGSRQMLLPLHISHSTFWEFSLERDFCCCVCRHLRSYA